MLKPHLTQANSVEMNPASSNAHPEVIIRQCSFTNQVRYLSDSLSDKDSDDKNAEIDAGDSSGSGRLPAVLPLKQ